MRIRPYIPDRDFDTVRNWITQEREHAMWCANIMQFPLNRDDFEKVMNDIAQRCGDSPYVATTDEGRPVGFFCYSVNCETNTGKFKFVMVDPEQRGRGLGKEMLRLAVKYAFEITKADMVDLIVFSPNIGAKKCYESVGFTEIESDSSPFSYNGETWKRCYMVLKNGGK